ncbi:MAG: alpha-L-fucosidase [Gemmatimonadales bacterium]
MTTRREFLAAAAAALTAPRFAAIRRSGRRFSPRPTPSPSQLAWQRDELAMFLHFGVNTFTDREWGDGHEDPAIFAPDALDARQWARAARAGGFRAMILTAKHHDGFCLWPTATTQHSVASSAWRNGQGDVVREFTEACRTFGLKAGVYLSPWDRNAPAYGDSPRYNDMYCAQLTELLTRYGPIAEVWFDGANGEGPNGRRQVYDWPRFWGLVRRLQPDAVMFSDAGPDIRWIGNEDGHAAETNWSTVDPAVVPYPGASGPAVTAMLQHGDPDGTVWRPGECDVSIRPGWFNHVAEDDRVKSVDQLVNLYCSSVGHNAKLLLNVPPDRHGLLHDTDVARLAGMRSALDAAFANDIAHGRHWEWRTDGHSAIGQVELGRARMVDAVDLAEDVARGQVVARYRVEGWVNGRWQTVSDGTTIGNRKIDRIRAAAYSAVWVTILAALGRPDDVTVALRGASSA